MLLRRSLLAVLFATCVSALGYGPPPGVGQTQGVSGCATFEMTGCGLIEGESRTSCTGPDINGDCSSAWKIVSGEGAGVWQKAADVDPGEVGVYVDTINSTMRECEIIMVCSPVVVVAGQCGNGCMKPPPPFGICLNCPGRADCELKPRNTIYGGQSEFEIGDACVGPPSDSDIQ